MLVIRLKEAAEEKHNIRVGRYYSAVLPEIQKTLDVVLQILP